MHFYSRLELFIIILLLLVMFAALEAVQETIVDLRSADNSHPLPEDAYLATELEKILARLAEPHKTVGLDVWFKSTVISECSF